MSIFDFLTLFGGLAMFLYGMRLMGDGLKESSSGALKKAMESVTNNPIKAFLLGLGVTAIIQSSTATIVITSGLVGAGLLSLHQSLGIIIGANVGTTVTGQIIRLLDLDAGGATSWLQLFKPSSLAPIALIIGIIIIMTGRLKSSRQIGNIAIGFGILFSGLLNMTSAVTVLTESGMVEGLFSSLGNNPFLGYVTGATVAFILQSSSATVGILQAFSASGMLTFKGVYPVIVGVYLGDSVTTGIVCFIGAQAEQKRVGIFNILFNIGKMALIFVGVEILHRVGVLDGIWNIVVNSGVIANMNTVFNIAASILLFPVVFILVAFTVTPGLGSTDITILDAGYTGGVFGTYVLLGYLVHEKVFRDIPGWVLSVVAVLSFLAIHVTEYFMHLLGSQDIVWYSWLPLIVTALCCFELLCRHNGEAVIPTGIHKPVNFVARYSFAMYLTHFPMTLVCVRVMYWYTTSAFLTYLVAMIVPFCLSLLLCWLLDRIPKVGRYLLYMR